MDDYVYRRDLISTGVLLDLSKRSNKAGTLRLASHVALIVISGLLVWLSYGTWYAVITSAGYGYCLTFLFAPLHECIHGTAFRSAMANKIVAATVGFLLLLPSNYFRLFHFQHHRYTNNAELDPELQFPKPSTKLQYFCAMSGLNSYWWPQLKALFTHATGRVKEEFIPESSRSKIILEARIHVFAYFIVLIISIYFQSYALLIFWVIPVMIGMIFLRLFLLAEHTGCEYTANMMLNTRTTLTNPLLRFITWNMPYHCEHHLFPSVPFHMLPKLHDSLKKRLSTVTSNYTNFHKEFIRSL